MRPRQFLIGIPAEDVTRRYGGDRMMAAAVYAQGFGPLHGVRVVNWAFHVVTEDDTRAGEFRPWRPGDLMVSVIFEEPLVVGNGKLV